VSALTKVFVLLLVILSIVQTAGVVVFVNREQSYTAALNGQKAAFSAAKTEADGNRQALDAAVQRFTALQAELQNARNLSNQQIEQLRGKAAEGDAANAQLTGQVQLALAAQKGATDALSVAQKSIDSQNTQLADLRKSNTDLQKTASDTNIALAERTNQFDTVNRQWKDAIEQLAQLQNTSKAQAEALHRAGADANSPAINQQPLVKVEGVVRSRTTVSGVPMATISIGSADQVTKGMRLSIIDPASNDPFLGYIEVDRVDPNQAIGHIFGPHVDRVRQGAEVRSQL
jgi:predicted  nucleic acid-binding Zn-ribbon protein